MQLRRGQLAYSQNSTYTHEHTDINTRQHGAQLWLEKAKCQTGNISMTGLLDDILCVTYGRAGSKRVENYILTFTFLVFKYTHRLNDKLIQNEIL